MAGGTMAVSVATELVMAPAGLVITTKYKPASLVCMPLMVRVDLVAPDTGAPLKLH